MKIESRSNFPVHMRNKVSLNGGHFLSKSSIPILNTSPPDDSSLPVAPTSPMESIPQATTEIIKVISKTRQRQKATLVSMSTQTDPMLPEPIVELSGRGLKVMDSYDMRRSQRVDIRTISVSSTGFIPFTAPVTEVNNVTNLPTLPASTPDSTNDRKTPDLSKLSLHCFTDNDEDTAPALTVSDPSLLSSTADVSSLSIEIISPKEIPSPVRSPNPSLKNATRVIIRQISNKRGPFNPGTPTTSSTSMSGPTGFGRMLSMKSLVSEELRIQELIKLLTTGEANGTINESGYIQSLFTPENVIALHKHFTTVIADIDTKKAELAETAALIARNTSSRPSTAKADTPLSRAAPFIGPSLITGTTLNPTSQSNSESVRFISRRRSLASISKPDESITYPKTSLRSSLGSKQDFKKLDIKMNKKNLKGAEESKDIIDTISPIEIENKLREAISDELGSTTDFSVKGVSFAAEMLHSESSMSATTGIQRGPFDVVVIPPPLKTDKQTTTDDSYFSEQPHVHRVKNAYVPKPFIAPALSLEVRRMPLSVAVQSTRSLATATVIDAVDAGYVSDSTEMTAEQAPHNLTLDLAEQRLRQSDNPLLTLHDLFGHSLEPAFSARLLRAAMDSESLERGEATVSNLFGPVLHELLKLNEVAAHVTREFVRCEHAASAVFQASCLKSEDSARILLSTSETFARILGELELSVMLFDIQLLEFRVIFEKINLMSVSTLPSLVNNNKTFADAFTQFTFCQSRSIVFKKKINKVYEFAVAYRIDSSELLVTRRRDIVSTSSNITIDAKAEAAFNGLQNEVVRLENELLAANKEVHRLEVELFEVAQSKDRTPNALLFFVALNDVQTTENLQQLTSQLKKLKQFVECKSHLDFVDLRKRLQICLSSIPYIDRFLSAFQLMHQQWTKRRLALFEKKSSVGEEDAMMMTMGNMNTLTSDLLRISGQLNLNLNSRRR